MYWPDADWVWNGNGNLALWLVKRRKLPLERTVRAFFYACASIGYLTAVGVAVARAQNGAVRLEGDADSADAVHYHFESRADSINWQRARKLARESAGFRIIVSLQDRHVWALSGQDTLLSAPAAVAKGSTLRYDDREWVFQTPRGMRKVIKKEADPIWQPPEWLYAETALENGLRLEHIQRGVPVTLRDGRVLLIKGDSVGIVRAGHFSAIAAHDHIVFDGRLFVPPLGSANRRVQGELGKYRLDLGDGYLLHGTPYKDSIGLLATHGCVRLRDEDIEWLFEHTPVGTRVYVY